MWACGIVGFALPRQACLMRAQNSVFADERYCAAHCHPTSPGSAIRSAVCPGSSTTRALPITDNFLCKYCQRSCYAISVRHPKNRPAAVYSSSCPYHLAIVFCTSYDIIRALVSLKAYNWWCVKLCSIGLYYAGGGKAVCPRTAAMGIYLIRRAATKKKQEVSIGRAERPATFTRNPNNNTGRYRFQPGGKYFLTRTAVCAVVGCEVSCMALIAHQASHR